MTLIDKIKEIPHKNLFFLGFTIVVIFLSLSYWQLNSYYDDKSNLQKLTTNTVETIQIVDINLFNEFDNVIINDVNVTKTWLLRSRVHNGNSGFNRIDLIKDAQNNYLIVNRGWVPLDYKIENNSNEMELTLIGKLITYDIQTFGQDDILNSDFIFRVDREFLENSTGKKLPNYYLILTDSCGVNIECVNLEEPYEAPHLSYAFQWLFFALCLTIVILRKNKFI